MNFSYIASVELTAIRLTTCSRQKWLRSCEHDEIEPSSEMDCVCSECSKLSEEEEGSSAIDFLDAQVDVVETSGGSEDAET